jgi:NAD(P)H-hydrate epimerase
MTLALPDADGHLTPAAIDSVLERAGRADAFVLGPGLGRETASLEFARHLAARIHTPLLIDADGLNAHAGALDDLAARPAPTVLTPHAGELGRLLERSSAKIAAHRLACVREAARRANAVVVLKGDDTLVADPSGLVAVNPGGASALATAGTGDVLSGVVGSYLAKGMDPFHAAAAGVFVHAAAGRLASRDLGPEGVIASDVITRLPRALPPLRHA